MKFLDQVDFDGMKMELIGTFAIVYMGGWAWINFFLETNDFISVGMSHLFAYAIFIWAGFPISGGLFNPGLAAVLIFFQRLNFTRGLFYIISQLIGSLLAASLLKLLTPEDNMKKISTRGELLGYPKSHTNFIFTGVYECIGTFFVVLVYYMVALTKDRVNAQVFGISVGSVYFANIMMFGVMTGGGSNIARYFGPGFISKDFFGLIFSSLGSLGGAAVAGFLCEKIILKDIKLLNADQTEEEKKDHQGLVVEEPNDQNDMKYNAEDSYEGRADISADLDSKRETVNMEL